MAQSLITCVQCGSAFARGSRGPVPRYCSAVCRARACDVRAQADGRFEEWSKATNARRQKPRVTLTCPYCEASFESARRDRQHCGAPECKAKWHSKRMQPYVHARRAAKAGVGAEPFSAVEIFERDGWTCWICEGGALSNASQGDPLSATLDHVVPLAKGGAHVRTNVRCAHLICNLRKGDRVHSGQTPSSKTR
ncbi:HNH endonuclease [Streptomyces sp. P8-A8]|uniref:HNH endonuclease n=1 Tax=Streptomyces sp. P8-A8 TaxID=3029759 RepID=UPI0036DB55E9